MNQRKATMTPADKAAARTLRALWDEKLAGAKEEGRGWTQESAGAAMGGMTQGAVSQYLNAKIPLGYEATLRFARFLAVPPTHIRDDLDALPMDPIGTDAGEGTSSLDHAEMLRAMSTADTEDLAEMLGHVVSDRSRVVLARIIDNARARRLSDDDIEALGRMAEHLLSKPSGPRRGKADTARISDKIKARAKRGDDPATD